MKKLNLKKKKLRQDGITLIALVVTIVVLLILAGITINFIMNGNSVLKQAQDAREEVNKARALEKIKMILSNYVIQKMPTMHQKTISGMH